jgi:hypothetical protein
MATVKPLGTAVLAAAILVSVSTAARAHPFTVDQANDILAISGGFTGLANTGQGFVPTNPLLDVVELMINDQSPGDGFGISMFVRIREATYTGTILGTSLPVSMPDFAPGPFIFPQLAHFDFSSPVALSPGSLHVIEVVNTSFPGDIGVFATGFNVDAYAAGEAYFLGLPASMTAGPNAPVDLWFREGIAAVPEPALGLVFGTAAVGVWVRRRRARLS